MIKQEMIMKQETIDWLRNCTPYLKAVKVNMDFDEDEIDWEQVATGYAEQIETVVKAHKLTKLMIEQFIEGSDKIYALYCAEFKVLVIKDLVIGTRLEIPNCPPELFEDTVEDQLKGEAIFGFYDWFKKFDPQNAPKREIEVVSNEEESETKH